MLAHVGRGMTSVSFPLAVGGNREVAVKLSHFIRPEGTYGVGVRLPKVLFVRIVPQLRRIFEAQFLFFGIKSGIVLELRVKIPILKLLVGIDLILIELFIVLFSQEFISLD